MASVSRKVSLLRRARRLSLDQLAARSTVSKGMLVQIEQGRANPSVATLCKVAAALGASVAELVEVGGGAPVHVVTAAAPRRLWTGSAGGSATLLVGSNGPDMLELWAWHLEPGERYDAQAHPEGTQELVHVTVGTLALEIEGVVYVIGAGESAFALTDRVHAYACASRRATRFTMVVAEWHAGRRPRREPRSLRS